MDEDYPDLAASLSGIARLLPGTVELPLLLDRVAQFAVTAVPGAEGAVVALMLRGQTETTGASGRFAAELDALQVALNEGPSITAVTERRSVRSGALTGDPTWPSFASAAGPLAVQSALALPLLLDADGIVGVLSVYAHDGDAFTDAAVRAGELFAEPAAVAVRNAQVLEHSRRLAEQLQAALVSRGVIDQAIGILISRTGERADEALATLRQMSQAEKIKLSAVAARLVDTAAKRARERAKNAT